MSKALIKKVVFTLIAIFSFTVLFNSCDSWMTEEDDFYEQIEEEVKRANAAQIRVFVRYAAMKMGKTNPDGYSTFKVDIPAEISATTEVEYGFKKWAAFSTTTYNLEGKQDLNFVYEDDESYKEKYGINELSSDVVKFADPTNPNTTVTIHEDRSDIFLMPVVAKRPTIALTMPANGSSGIVRNMTVRINFTKPMDEKTFIDDQGILDKITITEGTQSITADGDIEISSNDITDHFDNPSFSTNKKMITLKFKDDFISLGYSAQSYVTINISKDVADVYGYSMAEDIKLQFQVGSSFDTLSPRITLLSAGTGNSFSDFVGVYKDEGTVNRLGGNTQFKAGADGAVKADRNIDNPLYTEDYLAQRITDKINIRIVAEDITGSGSGQDQTGIESDVSMLGIRATSLIEKDGTPSPSDTAHSLPIKALGYLSQTNSSELISDSYRNAVLKADRNDKYATKGFLFSYDLSELPDGLIQVDVWAYDSVGNIGLNEQYSDEYGNGYASIFVVKDTTAPDAIANIGNIRTSSTQAPYGWYNASSLSTMQLYEASKGAVFDTGHPKLRSKAENLEWFFNVTTDTNWGSSVTKEDNRWRKISESYSISNANIPEKDGPIAISLIIKDDLGNISTVEPLSSIMYDNTSSVVEKPTWVTNTDAVALNASSTSVLSTQILKVPYTENLAGIRRVELKVNNVEKPMESAKFYSALPLSVENEIKVNEKDSANTDNILSFDRALETGTIYISGLTIGDTDGIYKVDVDLYDMSLNKSNVVSTTISKDTTNPVVVDNKVTVNNIISSTAYGAETPKNYLKQENYDSERNANKVSVSFNITETGSGINLIKFTQDSNVSFTTDSVIKVNGTELIKGETADYIVDIMSNSLKLYDSYSPKIFGENVAVTIENLRFNVMNGANVVRMEIADFVDTVSTLAISDVVYADNTNPSVASVVVSDRAQKNVNSFANDNIYETTKLQYTDEDKVTVTVKLAEENIANGVGVKTLTLNNAEFTADSKLKVSGTDVPCTFDGSTVTFTNPFAAGETLVFENVIFTNVDEGTKTITATPTDLINWKGAEIAGNSIVYDKTLPEPKIGTTGVYWTATSNSYVGGITGETELTTQILHIPFTEAKGAGLKKLRIQVERNGVRTEAPFVASTLQLSYKVSPFADETELLPNVINGYTKNGEYITFDTPLETGYIAIRNLHIKENPSNEDDGTYKITVTLMDSAENSDRVSETNIELTRDSVAPVMTKMEITPTLKTINAQNESEVKYWINQAGYAGYTGVANKVTAKFTIKEVTSGVRQLDFGENLYLTDAVVVKVGNEELHKGEDYTIEAANRTLKLTNSSQPKIKSEGEGTVVVTIENMLLDVTAGSAANLKVTATDWADKSDAGSTKSEITVEGEAGEIQNLYVSSTAPTVTAVTIIDRGTENGTDVANKIVAETGYTNEATVNLHVTVNPGTSSGIRGFKLIGGGKLTDSSEIRINGTATGAATSVVSEDKTTVTFIGNKVYAVETTFDITNVELITPAQGSNAVNVYAISPVGFNTYENDAQISTAGTVIYDTIPSSVSAMTWTSISPAVPGVTNENIFATQDLNISFVETIPSQNSGVRYIEIKATKDSDTTDLGAFTAENLSLLYNNTALTAGTDYELIGNNLIKLTNYKPSGTFTFKGLKISDSATGTDGVYNFSVVFTDISGNKNTAETKSIVNDNTAPVVTKIEIPGLKKSKELYKGVSLAGPDDTWWLDQEYIGGAHNGNYAATKVPLYITINESNSGVNLITLGGTMQLQSTSTLWTVAEDGTETAVDSAKYTVNTTANTIAINSFTDSLKNAADKSNFVILIKDLKANGVGGDSPVMNTVEVQVRDVALNESAKATTITQKGKATTLDGFYTDSWACGMDKIEIVDEKADPIPATEGYTNDELVTIYAACVSEGKGTSGHNRFVFTGAKFTDNSEVYFATSSSSSSTALGYVKTADSTYRRKLLPTEYVISEDKSTIELRNADASEYYVFRANVALKVTNMQLDDVATNGSKTVKAQAFDLAGWDESANIKSKSIIFDNTKPEWRFEAGTFAANKSETIKGEFIYPHPNATDTAYGIKSPTVEKNNDGEIVLYYYTASKLAGSDDYGVVIGIGGKDANLRGFDKKNGVPYYICDTTDVSLSVIDAKYVVTYGSMPSTDCNGNTTGNNPGWKTEVNGWENMYAGHTYSIVIVDEAGNYSTAKTIKIVQDTIKPSLTYDSSAYISGGNKSLGNLFWIETEGNVFRNTKRANHEVKSNDKPTSTYEMSANDFDWSSVWTYDYVVKQGKHEITINLGKAVSGKTQLDGSSSTPDAKYSESEATSTSSPLEMYAISHRYRQWSDNADDDSTYPFIPAFPVGTVSPDGKDLFDLFGYEGETKPTTKNHQFTSNVLWRNYEKGVSYTDDKISHKVDDNGNIVITLPTNTLDACPPLTLLLKDGTGNLNYLHIKPVSMEDSGCKTVSWVIDTMLSTDTSAPANRHVGFIPYATTNKKANDSNVTNDSNYKAIDLNGNVTTASYNWGNPTGPYQIGGGNLDGQTVIGTQARDLKSRITYYNEKAYMGIALKAETCNYSERKIASSNFADGKGYTLRARVRAWDATGAAPAKTDFDGSGSDFSSWVYLRDDGSDGNNNIFLQYPHPSRTSKFRLYYYVEDAVGNYEIDTITNDNKTDEAADQMLYWMYDNAGPSVLTRSGDNPETITGANINKLVATNNGFRPYYNAVTGTGYIVETKNKIVGTGLPDKNSLGQGVILGCLRGEDAKYGSYFDLDITETSGIRAFAYTTTSTYPTILTSGNYGTASMGDAGNWYAGKTTCDGGTGMLATREIGSTLSYPYYPATSGTSLYSKAGDVTYDYYEPSYGKDIYSGVKVVATIPYGVIKEDSITPKDVYLHVMDWVGNITTVKLGDGIQWVNDSAGANNDGKTDTNIFKDNCNITCYNIEEPWNLQYTFASTKIPSDATSIKIYMPEGKYSDDAGSGLLGWSLTPYNLNLVDKDAGQTDAKYSYIEIPSDKLDKIKAGDDAGIIPVYIYDNVGNCAGVTLKLVGDSEPNEFTIYVRPGTSGKLFYIKDSPSVSSQNQSTGSESSGTEITSLSEITAEAYTNDSKVTYLARFKDKKPASDLRTLSIDRYTGSETDPYDASKWINLQTKTGASNDDSWHYSAPHSDEYYYLDNAGSPLATDSNYLYYRLVTQDKAGNTNYAYVKVATDNTAPTASISAENISKVNTYETVNFYNSASSATVTVTDSGAGVKSYAGTNVTGYEKSVNTEIKLSDISKDTSSHTLKLSVTDNLGNTDNAAITYNSVSNWIYDATLPVATALTTGTATYFKTGLNELSYSGNNKLGLLEMSSYDTNYGKKATINVTATDDDVYTVSVSNVSELKYKLEVTDSNFAGWVINTTGLIEDFVSSNTVLHTDTYYSFDSQALQDTTKTYYFYPVDKAGNHGNPIKIKFVNPNIPVISEVTWNYEGNNVASANNINYFDETSRIKVKVTNNGSEALELTSYVISTDTQAIAGTVSKNIASGSSDYVEIPLESLKDANPKLTNKDLYINVATATASSSYETSLGKWSFDAAVPVITINGINTTAEYSIVKVDDKNYFNSATIDYAVSDDSVITNYALTTSTLTPTDWNAYTSGSTVITIPDTANGESYYLHFKDILGHSACKAITANSVNAWVHDAAAPTGTLSIAYTNEGDGYYLNGNTLYYNTSLKPNTVLTPNGYTDGIFAGYTIGETGVPSDTITYTPSGTSFDIYAWDKVGNKVKADTINLTSDSSAPEPSAHSTVNVGYTGNASMSSSIKGFAGHSIVAADGTTAVTLLTGHDNQHGDGYITNLYPSGSKLVLPITLGTPKVAYVIKGGNTVDACATPENSDYSEYVELTEEKLTVAMPSVSDYHSFIFVFLKDQVGNVTVYNIGKPGTPTENWMCEYKSVEDTSPAADLVENGGKDKYILYLTGLSAQTPIKSIKLIGSEIGYQNYTVKAYYGSQPSDFNTVKINATYGTSGTSDEYNPTFTFVDNKNNALNYIAGAGRIEIEILKNYSQDKDTEITSIILTDCNGKIKTIDSVGTTAPAANNSRKSFATAVSSVKSLFTPKTKKIDLKPQQYTSVPSVVEEITESVQEMAAPSTAEKTVVKAKKTPARTKGIASRSSSAAAKSVVQAVIPENANVMEASAIDLNPGMSLAGTLLDDKEDSNSSIISAVENTPAPENHTKLIAIIATLIVAFAIGCMLIINKKIIDKYN